MKILFDNGALLLSQSTMKSLGFAIIDDQLFDFDICPKQFKLYYIDEYERPESMPMTYGRYAETMMIGGGRGGQQTLDIPRLKNGDKCIEHKRIDQHVRKFQERCDRLGIDINKVNTQIPLIAQYSNKVFISGEMDVFPAYVGGEMAIIDLKYTKNAFTTYCDFNSKITFDCCYGNYEYLNKIQAVTYRWLLRNTEMPLLKKWWKAQSMDYERLIGVVNEDFLEMVKEEQINFYWFVCGSSACDHIDDQFNWIRYIPMRFESTIFDNLVQSAVNKFVQIRSEGFPAVYCKSCQGCPIRLDCETFKEKQQ